MLHHIPETLCQTLAAAGVSASVVLSGLYAASVRHGRGLARRLAETEQTLTSYGAALASREAALAQRDAALKEASRKNEDRADLDSLTGLMAHGAFRDRLGHMVADSCRKNAPLALLLLDLDYFKQYNDSQGHTAGDGVLKAVGELIAAQIRAGDVCAREGGDSFAVLLPGTGPAKARLVAERIRAAIADLPCLGRAVSVSVGIALAPAAGRDAQTLLHAAEAALTDAKRRGRNCVFLEDSHAADVALPTVTRSVALAA